MATLPNIRIECGPTNEINVATIIAAINANNESLKELNTEIQAITTILANMSKIKTRRDANILYMTDDGTNP